MKTLRQLLLIAVLTALLPGCDSYDPYHPDTSNLQGIWADDNSDTRRGEEMPIDRRVTVYATHMEFTKGNGTYGTEGEWRDGGFWCYAKGSSDEIEAVMPVAPEEVEMRMSAFEQGNGDVYRLYKERGSDEEMAGIEREMAAKFPPPLTYPPARGAVVGEMTEYQLLCLPWKPDRKIGLANEQMSKGEDPVPPGSDATIYYYHSDNPQVSELRVTVKDHRVIGFSGGNE